MSNLVTFNEPVSLADLRRILPIIGPTNTLIIQSEPGCGKSSLLKMLAEDHGDKYHYVYMDCPLKDVGDIAMNIPVHETKSLEQYITSLVPFDGKPVVLMLDEFMKSPKLMQVLYTRLMLERSLGDRQLPEGSIVFATSNNASDGVGDTMLAHAGNRVTIVQMRKPNEKEWNLYATDRRISAVIRAWVEMNPRLLASYTDEGQEENPFIFNPKKSNNLSFVSPRSLEKSDPIVKNRAVLGDAATKALLAGTVGRAAAEDLSAFLALEAELLRISDILKEPTKITVPEKPAALFMLMFNAVDVLETQDDLANFMRFVKRVEASEIQACFFTMLCQNRRTMRLAKGNKEVLDWAAKNYMLLM